MASIQDIRRRIRSVKNTQQVTKAMKMISAVKLRKSQERLVAMRPYATKLLEVVRSVVGRLQQEEHTAESPLAGAFLVPREEKRIRVLVVASDKGLCGGFNANLLKQVDVFLRECSEVAQLDVFGKRASDWARKHGRKTGREFITIPIPALPKVAAELAADAIRQYEAGEIDALYVVYNYFHSPVSQSPTVMRIFPMAAEKHAAEIPLTGVSHLLEPDPQTVLEALLPQFVEMEIMRCLFESTASEHGARMSAMDKASSNAAEMIDRLTLHMNKIRQAGITNQIIEIVSGANA